MARRKGSDPHGRLAELERALATIRDPSASAAEKKAAAKQIRRSRPGAEPASTSPEDVERAAVESLQSTLDDPDATKAERAQAAKELLRHKRAATSARSREKPAATPAPPVDLPQLSREQAFDEATRGLRETIASPTATDAARARASLALAELAKKIDAAPPPEREATDWAVFTANELELANELSKKAVGEPYRLPYILPREPSFWRGITTEEAEQLESLLGRVGA